jgi:hypothetical protein
LEMSHLGDPNISSQFPLYQSLRESFSSSDAIGHFLRQAPISAPTSRAPPSRPIVHPSATQPLYSSPKSKHEQSIDVSGFYPDQLREHEEGVNEVVQHDKSTNELDRSSIYSMQSIDSVPLPSQLDAMNISEGRDKGATALDVPQSSEPLVQDRIEDVVTSSLSFLACKYMNYRVCEV